MPTRRLVCLANSKKGRHSYCFAGFDRETRTWVRPIGSGWQGAVSSSEEQFADGTRPELLDLVDVPLRQRAPEPGQPENWEMRPTIWTRAGHLSAAQASAVLAPLVTTDPLFGSS